MITPLIFLIKHQVYRMKKDISNYFCYYNGYYLFLPGYEVAHLGEALHYKPGVHRFDIHWGHWAFSMTYSLRPHYESGVDSPYCRKDYQDYILGVKGGVGLTTLPPSCADCLEILGSSTSWSPRRLPTSVYGFTYFIYFYQLLSTSTFVG